MDGLSLDELLVRLKQCRPEQNVRYDFEYLVPTTVGSFRMWYEQMTLGYGLSHGSYPSRSGGSCVEVDPTVASLIEHIESKRGGTVMSWKSGDYPVRMDTPVWVANPGNASDTQIVAVRSEGTNENDAVILITGYEPDLQPWSRP